MRARDSPNTCDACEWDVHYALCYTQLEEDELQQLAASVPSSELTSGSELFSSNAIGLLHLTEEQRALFRCRTFPLLPVFFTPRQTLLVPPCINQSNRHIRAPTDPRTRTLHTFHLKSFCSHSFFPLWSLIFDSHMQLKTLKCSSGVSLAVPVCLTLWASLRVTSMRVSALAAAVCAHWWCR